MSSASKIQKLLREAVAFHQAGRLPAAEALYAKVIRAAPDNADALHLLGVIAHSRGQNVKARKFFDRAIACGLNTPDVHLNLGNLLISLDDKDGAKAAYERAIALRPNFFDAHLGLGGVLYAREQFEEAARYFSNVTLLAPQNPRGHFNLGQSLIRLSRLDEAEACFRRAVDLDPTYLDAHIFLSDLYSDAERLEEAIHHTRLILGLQPLPEHQSNLGELLRRNGAFEAALDAHRIAVKAKPDDLIILHNYGAALHAAQQYDEAERIFRRAIDLDRSFIKGHVGLAKVYEFQGRLDLTIATLERALAVDPQASDVLFKLSLRHLMAGVFVEGWKGYECRFLTADKEQPKRSEPPAYWAGEDLRDKTILIWTEQGLGDEILYGSMISDMVARARHCVVETSPRLVPVFARSFPQAKVDSYRSTESLTEIDFQIPAASLGQFLRRDFESFPRHQGYLKADPARAAVLRARYRALAPGNLVVGISWRSRNEDVGVIKSTDLSSWADILVVPGITFINLQYGDCADELAAVKRNFGVEVFHDTDVDPLRSMDDFFAQVAAMDLVVSTSNTTVHVAGSLNVPTWLLVSNRPGGLWYWFYERADSPWYPSLKVLRNSTQTLELKKESWWTSVMSQAARELTDLSFDSRTPSAHEENRRGV